MTRRIEVDPDRRQRIAEAVAMVKGGSSQTAASLATNVPRSTIAWWIERLANDPDAMKGAEQRLAATYAAVAQAGMERIAEELPNMATRDLITATGVASDKLARIRGWGAPTDGNATNDALGHALKALAQTGGTVSVTVTTTEPPIDVTPTGDSE